MSSDMDQEWKPTKIRPQSTMAQDFSSALDSAFMLDSDVNHLSQTIDQKKQQMMIQSRELEELQQRIRDAENRLKSRQSVNFGSSSTGRNGEGQTAAPREGPVTEQPQEEKAAETAS
ncbi:uncharacterized protein N7469_001705 [Penicillium citrinum]|uniref:Uncharacterized protein n=2 Tax=Penicillium TaxID=5073 RepID=A0A9W9PFU5_PENCI|nr:uncharacterized protein N7469_001705 [Penicillium citrinum]KAJ5243378.1 hypothetical protein N7469_001705 [Penicillium citrinum]KAJ5599114.1 hypothetical protein N7450_000181 [Penicillium hetheringtonii]